MLIKYIALNEDKKTKIETSLINNKFQFLLKSTHTFKGFILTFSH